MDKKVEKKGNGQKPPSRKEEGAKKQKRESQVKPGPNRQAGPDDALVCRWDSKPGGCKKRDSCKFVHKAPPAQPPADSSKEKAGAVPPIAETVVHSPGELYRRKTVALAATDVAAVEYAREQGWNIAPLKTLHSIPHPLSHLARAVALLQVAARGLENVRDARVLSLYGTGRDVRLLQLSGYDTAGAKLSPANDSGSVQVDIGPNEFYPGDSGKVCPRHEPKGLYNLVVATDVYWDGEKGPITTDTLKNWCRYSVKGTCYLIIRSFDGLAGCDVVPGYRGPVEGVWFKDVNGMVSFSSDSCGYGYPLHYPIDAVRHSAIDGLSILYFQRCGPYDIISVTLDSPLTRSVPVYPQLQERGDVQWREFARVGWYWSCYRALFGSWAPVRLTRGFLRNTTHTHRLMVHVPTVGELGPKYSRKVANGHVGDVALAQTQECLNASAVMRAVKTRYPLIHDQILRDTANAVVFEGRDKAAEVLLALREDQVEAEQALVAARAPTMEDVRPSPWFSAMDRAFFWKATQSLMHLLLTVLLVVLFTSGIPGARAESSGKLSQLSTAAHEVSVWRHPWPLFQEAVERHNLTCPAIEAPVWEQFAFIGMVSVDRYYAAGLFSWALHALPPVLWGNDLLRGVLTAFYRAFFVAIGYDWLVWVKDIGRVHYACRPAKQWENRNRFGRWIRARINGEDVDDDVQTGWESLTERDTVPAETCLAVNTTLGRGTMRVSVEGREMGVKEAVEVLRDLERNDVRKVSHPLAVTNGMLHQPDCNDSNLLASIVQRMHSEVVGETDSEALENAWDRAISRITGYVTGFVADRVPLVECAREMGGAKGRKLLDVGDKMVRHGARRYTRGVMVKWNETICLKEINGVMSLKPRCITVLSDNFHVDLSQYARGVSSRLHEIFDGSEKDGIRIFYAAGYSGAQLNAVGEALYAADDVIAVSGDDSVVCFAHASVKQKCHGKGFYGEGDFKAFDQSEREECLRAHAQWLVAIGVPPRVIDILLSACSGPYRARGKRLYVKGDAGFQLATGVDLTTILNSMTNLAHWRESLADLRVSFLEHARRLGLSLKMHESFNFHQLTFLKGWWQPDRLGNVTWYPLPSQVLKIGKILREPRLFSETGRDWAEGVRKAAYGMASSLSTVPREYPILGPFLAMFDRLGVKTATVLSASEDGWFKPTVAGVSVSRDHVIEQVCTRYDVTFADVMRAEQLLCSVTALPAYIEDPVFSQLRDRDYV